MRYALVSDIHANLQAWRNVYEDIQSNNVDRIICLGDIVGYGPNPAEVVRALRNSVDAFVLGNHDAALCDKLDINLFNDDAKKLIEWTRKQLTPEDIAFVGGFPLTLIGDGFLCAHGSFNEPANFDYIGEAEEAQPSWKATDANLLIVGHTHEPALFVLGASGVPRTVEPQDFAVDQGKRYLVNIGSVGQPRGADNRSCYCIYDTETKSIYWRRVGFDVEAYRKALKATGLSLDASYFMMPEPKTAAGTPPKRRIVFTPPKSPDKAARNVLAVQDLKSIPPRKKKIPLNVISTVVVLVAIATILIWKRTHPAMDMDGTAKAARSRVVLTPFAKEVIEPGEVIPGWFSHVDNRYHQRIGVNLDTFGMPFCYLTSKSEKESLSMSSPWIPVKPGQSWDLDAAFQLKKDFEGTLSADILLESMQGGKPVIRHDFLTRTPEAAAAGSWSRVREKVTIPEEGTRIQFRIGGTFKGTVLAHQMTLTLVAQGEPPAAPATNTKAAVAPEETKPVETPAAAVEAPPAAAPTPETPPTAPAAPSDDPWHTKAK